MRTLGLQVLAALAGFALLVAATVVVGSCAGNQNSPSNQDAGNAGHGGQGGTPTGSGGSTGSGGFSAGLGGSTASGAGGSGAAVDAGADASGGGGAPGGCSASVTMVSPPDLTKLEAFPGSRARVTAVATGARTAPPSFTWTVIWTDQPSDPLTTSPTVSDGTNSTVEFPVEHEGTYRITAQVVGDLGCFSTKSAFAWRAVFVLRATAAGFPVQDSLIGMKGAGAPPTQTVLLDPGDDARVAPRNVSGDPLVAYVRVSSSSSSVGLDGDTLHGALLARLIPSALYNVLIVPMDDLAPLLISDTPQSWQARTLVVDAGISVPVTVRDGAHRPLQGARMILRRDALPSTVGTSDATGAMTLLARAGTLSAYVVAPDGSGLPPVNVGTDGDAGIALDGSGTVALDMAWDALPTAPLSVEVHALDGTTRVVGAQVRATSRGTPAKVGTLTVRRGAASTPLRAVGGTDIQVSTDGNGVATFPALPLGDLTLTVIPPATMDGGGAGTSVAVTRVPVTLTAAGLSPTVITQASKVTLSGMILPAGDSAGAVVTAIDNSINAPGRIVTATVGGDGSYRLTVDPSRGYQVIADLPAGAPVSRALLGTIPTGASDTTVPAATLPIGHLVSGTVMSTKGGVVPNARVQIFCPPWSAQCVSPDFALADVVSDGNGAFHLGLPEPTVH